MSVSFTPIVAPREKQILIVGGYTINNHLFQPVWNEEDYHVLRWEAFMDVINNSLHKQIRMPEAILLNLDEIPKGKLTVITKTIEQHERLRNTPLIGLKQDFNREYVSQLLKMGFDDCYRPPFPWKQLKRRVDLLNRHRDKLIQAAMPAPPDEPFRIPTTKRMFDIFVSSSLLILLSPLFLLIAICIKLESRGPVFYTSKRVGTGYQVFDFIKFRSMQPRADTSLSQLIKHNNYKSNKKGQSDENIAFFKMQNDPRVTRIGKIIRKTSIDELPQLINVLRGEMSLVGNRPLPLYEATQLTRDDWARRFMAPAGLTGLWQVDERGKDNVSAEERIRLDMDYAKNYSFWMDLKIMLKTLPAMVQRD